MSGEGKRRRTPEILILITAVAAACLSAAAFLYKPDRPAFTVLIVLAAVCTLVSVNLIIFSIGAGAVRIVLMALMLCMLIVILAYVFYYLFTRGGRSEISVEDSDHSDSDMHIAPSEKDYSAENLHNAAGYDGGYETNVSKNASHTSEDISELTEISDPATPVDSETISFMETEITDSPVVSVSEIDDENVDIDSNEQKTDAYSGVSEPDTADEVTPAIVSHEDDEAETLPDPAAETALASIPPAPVIPDSTTIIEPVIPDYPDSDDAMTAEPESLETYGVYTDPYSDEDFWASFYIAGQDEFVLADGLYYMTLLINDINTGVISTRVENGEASVSISELMDFTYDTLTEESRSRLFTGKDGYISLQELENSGVETGFDSSTYEIRLYFAPQDMPVQILSISSSSRRAVSRPISGGVNIDPAFFTLISQFNLSMGFDDISQNDIMSSFWGYFSNSNRGRIHNVDFDFSLGIRFSEKTFDFSGITYNFHRDFSDSMIRLSWGMVNTSLLSPSGAGIGIRFDKSLSYSNGNVRNRQSHTDQVIVVEKTSDVEVFNEGRSIFKKTLPAGMYRLQDFILYSGANRILIRISPLDGSPVNEVELNVLYSASLLAPGEVYYGASLAFSRKISDKNSEKPEAVFSLPFFNDQRIDYDLSDIVLSAYIRAGLSETLTMNATLALQNSPDALSLWGPNASLAMEFTNVNILGNSRLSLTVTEKSDDDGRFTLPSLTTSLGHQASTGMKWLSSLSIGLSWNNPSNWNFDNHNLLSFNAGIGGSIGMIGWNLSAFGGFDLSDPEIWSWSASANISTNLGSHVYLSGSLNVIGVPEAKPEVRARITASMRFDGTSISTSTDFSDASVRLAAGGGRHSFSGSLTTSDFTDWNAWNVSASYSYGGNRVSGGINLNTSQMFERVGLSANLSTSTVFADGLFAVASSIPSNFLLVRQKGALKDNEISIGTPGASSFADIPTTFGTALYTGLPAYGNTSLMVYSAGEDQFASTESLAVNLVASDMKGYVLRIEAEDSFAVSGLVYLPDGTLWLNGSSPLYLIDSDEYGNTVTTVTDEYLFTDNDGRFVMSQLPAGIYGFDVPFNGNWLLYVFPVDGNPDSYSKLQMLSTPEENKLQDNLQEIYQGSYIYEMDDVISSEQFFVLLYPEIMEDAV